ncbi:TlpA family protein disulfide reductase [Natronobacterium texcoconense]|uniref:Thiol-disulfide isomerase or thioredoxin n=1 Tax=Natronobacterium texcoconense TaxID=1095778 RepID=A0A1H1FHJ9_NATTX|nr:TlpA disulfide reductase family protein [Natronobacterium texcoconense]SDR00340.1 Thiol-disulfide isomerase or thioredoxin [Natronobacterium texcoconense]
MRNAALTRRGLVALAATTSLSGCLGLFSGIAGNNIPSSVPPDLRHESLGVVGEESMDLVTDADLTLVYFFATWCGPCEPQLESLHEVREEYDSETLAMRAISPEDEEGLVTDYWDDEGADWPAGIDPDSDVHDEFGVSVYPSIVIVDSDGDVRWHTSGNTGADDITDAIDAELE